jgi:hypothetical protein
VSFIRKQIFPLFGAGMTLAIGVALGAGPLQGDDGDGSNADMSTANAELGDEVAALEAGQTFDEAVAAGVAPGLLENRLAGRTVTLIVLPGVSEERAEAARLAIKSAGGVTAVSVSLDAALLDPGKKTYVASVAASSLDGASDLAKSAGDEPYQQLGALIARAYVGHGDGIEIDDEAIKIDSEVQGAKLVTVSGEPHQRGSLTIVLASGAHGDGVSEEALQLISAALIQGLAAGSDGTVVVTPASGADPGGLIDAIGDDASMDELPLSTLNVSGGSAADVAMVYALAAAAGGKPGSFGVDGSSVVLPPGMPAAPAGEVAP